MNKTSISIKELREKADLSQDELAQLLGVSKRTVAYWESGEKAPQPRMARKIDELLTNRGIVEKPALPGDKMNRERALIKVLLHEVARLKAKDEGISIDAALSQLKQNTNLVLDDLDF